MLLSTFLQITLLSVFQLTLSNPELHIIGLFPTTHDRLAGSIGRGVRPAVELAIDKVNSDPRILPNWNLTVNWNDTKCDMAVATRLFFDMMHENTTKIILFGDACFNVTGPLVQISKWWNMTQLSYADTNPLLSDRKEYENFYRTVPSDSDFNPARLALLRKFRWKRIGTIYQDTSEHAQSNNKLVSLLEQNNISVHKEGSFADDADTALTKLQESEIRIIIGLFSPNVAPNVFCNAHKRGMYGEKYQWIILGGYPEDWWKTFDENCTRDQMNETIHGYIATDILPLSSSNQVTDSGWTSSEYLEKYNEHRGLEYSKFHGYAFDGIWVIAKAFDLLTRKRKRRSTDLSFNNDEVRAALNATDFLGVTGIVRFHNGDRVGGILFEQFQGGRMVKIGEYNQHEDYLNLSMENNIIWRGIKPPLDGYVRIEVMQRVSILAYAIFSSLAVIGITLAGGFLAFNVKFRKHRYIKMSSPNMNNMIILGCILTYTSVLLLGTDGRILSQNSFAFMCNARAWVLSIGFTLAFGAMFSKTWRVHAIFTNIKMNKKVIKDYKLFLMVGVLLVVDGVMLGTWWAMDPFHIASKELSHSIEDDYEIVPIVESCASEYMTIWMGLIYAYKGLLLVIGCFLAWETRHVSIPALNDSKYIGMSVYNVVIMCTCGAAVSIIIKDQPTSAFIIIGLFIIFCTTITLCLLFVPKIIELRRDPKGDERSRVRATLKKPSSKQNSVEPPHSEIHQKLTVVNNENIRYKEVLEQKNKAIERLMEQLGEDIGIYDSSVKTPVHKMVEALRTTDTSPGRYSRSTITSDGDTTSMISDLSAATSIWQVDSPSGQRIYLHLRAMGEDTSCTESIELVDFSSKPTFTKLTPMTEEYLQSENYDADYAAMFYGRSMSGQGSGHNNHMDPNEPAELTTLPAKEEHPLIHSYGHIAFLDANGGQDDESTDSMPMESARRDLADEQRSIISGDMPELEDSDDEGTLIEYEDCEWTDRRLSESTTSWHDTFSGGGGLDDDEEAEDAAGDAGCSAGGAHAATDDDDDGDDGGGFGGGVGAVEAIRGQVYRKRRGSRGEDSESSGSAENLIPAPAERTKLGDDDSPERRRRRHHPHQQHRGSHQPQSQHRHPHQHHQHHHDHHHHYHHEHYRYADAEERNSDLDDEEDYYHYYDGENEAHYDENEAEEPIVSGTAASSTRTSDSGSPCCSSCSNTSSSTSSSLDTSTSSYGSSPCYLQTLASFEDDSTSPELAASPVTVVAVSPTTCCYDTSIGGGGAGGGDSSGRASSSSSNNNNSNHFNNNNNNNTDNNNVSSRATDSRGGLVGRVSPGADQSDSSAATAATAPAVTAVSTALSGAVAPVTSQAKPRPTQGGALGPNNNNELRYLYTSQGTRHFVVYKDTSLTTSGPEPKTSSRLGRVPPKVAQGPSESFVRNPVRAPQISGLRCIESKGDDSEDEQQEIFVDAPLDPSNPGTIPPTRVVRPMLTCDIIERV